MTPPLLAAAWLLSFARLQAVEPAPAAPALTLEAVFEAVGRDNPEIRAAQHRRDAASRRIRQAATPAQPRLELERMYAPRTADIAAGAPERSFSVTQELPFPGALYLRRGVAAREAETAEEAYRAKELDILSRARSAFASLALAGQSIEIFEENVGIMRRFAKVAESKYAAGRGGQSDALKAQVELTKMLNMAIALEQEQEAAAAALNALMGREAAAPLGRPEPPPSPKLAAGYEELRAHAQGARPELRQARLAEQRASWSLSLARADFFPELMLQYRRRNDAMRGVTHDGVVGFSLPLWFWKPAGMVAEARAEREAAGAERRAAELMTDADLRTSWTRVKTTERLAENYRTSLLPQAEAALRVAEAGYQTDKTSFLDFLDAQRSFINFKLEYYQTLADFQERLAELERAVGRRLP